MSGNWYEEYGIQPRLFYEWQQTFFTNGEQALLPAPFTTSVPSLMATVVTSFTGRLESKPVASVAEPMTEEDVEIILQRAREKFPDARQIVRDFIQHYNEVRLHSAIGYVTPKTNLEGEEKLVFARRKQKLEQARQHRRKQYLNALRTVPV